MRIAAASAMTAAILAAAGAPQREAVAQAPLLQNSLQGEAPREFNRAQRFAFEPRLHHGEVHRHAVVETLRVEILAVEKVMAEFPRSRGAPWRARCQIAGYVTRLRSLCELRRVLSPPKRGARRLEARGAGSKAKPGVVPVLCFPLRPLRHALTPSKKGSGTPTNAVSQPPHLVRRLAPCKARSPVGVPPRFSPKGLVIPKAQLQARLPGTRSERALPAFACPSPGMHLPPRS